MTEVNEVADFFAAEGPAARRLPGFRTRPEQLEMARAVAAAMAERRHLLVEAGTGVGKSLGYLVPAVLEAVASGRRVLVSTQTLSLQDQLIGKDIPFLEKVLPGRFRAELAKGRSNYLAPRRLELALGGVDEVAADAETRQGLLEIRRGFDRQHWTERQHFHPQPRFDVWEQVQSEHGNCLGKSCPHHDDDCPYHVARRRLADADLIVVNHSLYLSDLALRMQGARILPDHDVVVFDEAHGLETTALEHFGARLTLRMLRLLLMRLHRRYKGLGFLQLVPGSERARMLCEEVEAVAEDFFGRVRDFCGGGAREREIVAPDDLQDDLSTALGELAGALADLRFRCDSEAREIEFQSYIARIDQMRDGLRRILSPGQGGRPAVHWAETGIKPSASSIQCKPLEAAEILRTWLFDRVGSVILTSATLATGRQGGLTFAARSLGAEAADQLQLGSPFDYEHNVRLRVPTWLDEPRSGPDYEESLANALMHYLRKSQGGAFVLFTSYDFMRRIRDRVADELRELGFPLLVQGEEMPRAMMIEAFRESQNSVLFGNDSFWQGVDVQGETLRLVVLVRLPFAVPTAPLQRARAKLVEERGGHSFRDLSLPEAIIKFKQGFGRLIRTETDRGTVVVLDTRILSKPYGKAFIEALPPVQVIRD
ncbi:MAG: helicase [Planctomycetes bacterium]|nr:helicase [Planctomycetota bacterium]